MPRTSFIAAMVSELTWRKVIAMQGFLVVFTAYRFFPYVPPPGAAVVSEVMGFNLLIATLFANEAVNRGTRPLIVYPVSLLCAAILTGFLQWHLRAPFHLSLRVDDLDPRAWHKKYQHMVLITLDTILFGSCVMLVYVSRLRELACVQLARDAELLRAQTERELNRSRFAAIQMRLDPEQIVDQLRHLRYLYQSGKADAEQELDVLVRELRRRTLAVPAPVSSEAAAR
jgi:hypothetical protein